MAKVGKKHKVGRWVLPLKTPHYGLFKTVPTGTFRMKPARSYTKNEADWRFAKYLKRSTVYFLGIVETTETQVKPEDWKDTNLT